MKILKQHENVRVVLVRPSLWEDSELCHAFYRLRDDIFAVKYHWEESRGEERDRYDDGSEFFLALEKDVVVAGCRAIHRNRLAPNGHLPIEEFLFAGEIVPADAIELSRMINVGKRVTGLMLYQAMYQHLMVTGNRTEVYAVIREQFLSQLKKRMPHLNFEEVSNVFKQRGDDIFVPVRIGEANAAHFRSQYATATAV